MDIKELKEYYIKKGYNFSLGIVVDNDTYFKDGFCDCCKLRCSFSITDTNKIVCSKCRCYILKYNVCENKICDANNDINNKLKDYEKNKIVNIVKSNDIYYNLKKITCKCSNGSTCVIYDKKSYRNICKNCLSEIIQIDYTEDELIKLNYNKNN